QADHIVTGRAVIDAARDAGNRWVFRDLAAAGLEPWNVRHVLLNASPQAQHAVDVTETFDRGMASLAAHREYLRRLGQNGNPAGFLTRRPPPAGVRLGTSSAAPSEVIGVCRGYPRRGASAGRVPAAASPGHAAIATASGTAATTSRASVATGRYSTGS